MLVLMPVTVYLSFQENTAFVKGSICSNLLTYMYISRKCIGMFLDIEYKCSFCNDEPVMHLFCLCVHSNYLWGNKWKLIYCVKMSLYLLNMINMTLIFIVKFFDCIW